MSDYRYLVDSNALSKLTSQQRSSDFFRHRCRIAAEVLYEARYFNDIERLKELEYRTTGRVLAVLAEVLTTIQPSDHSLIDLYRNKGNADPLIVACAIDAQREVQTGLFGETWAIVTNDKAVIVKAQEFGIPTFSSTQFLDALANDDAVLAVQDTWKDWADTEDS